MREAQARGLRLKADPPADPDALRWARSASDKDGRLYDSRHGVAGYYRYGPRKIHDLSHMRFSSTEDNEVTIDVPKIHCSAIERIINGAHAYAPIGFPDRYAVVDPDGKILNLDDPKNAYETPAQATARKDVQERVWNPSLGAPRCVFRHARRHALSSVFPVHPRCAASWRKPPAGFICSLRSSAR